jgi:CheY-like chemotaxis protein/signal transduction histidine kinase
MKYFTKSLLVLFCSVYIQILGAHVYASGIAVPSATHFMNMEYSVNGLPVPILPEVGSVKFENLPGNLPVTFVHLSKSFEGVVAMAWILSASPGTVFILIVIIVFLLLWNFIDYQKYKKKLNTSNQQLKLREQKDKEIIDKLFSQISQDIRTPLNGIVGMTELLRQMPATEKQEECLNIIAVSSNNLVAVVSDLFEFSRFGRNDPVLEKISFSIHDIIAEVSDILSDKINEKRLQLITFIDPAIPYFLSGDPIKLRQILLIIVRHAVHRTPKGEIQLFTEFVRSSGQQYELKFRIKDNGPEISMNEQVNVFTDNNFELSYLDFLNPENPHKFLLIKRIVNLMGGQAGIESATGNGVTYWFTVSLEKVNEDISKQKQSGFDLHDLNILILDENNSSRAIFRKYLRFFGCTFSEAESIEKAKVILQQDQVFDVILYCLNTQNQDVSEFGQLFNEESHQSRPKFILISSTGYLISPSQMRKLGFDAYLNKPVKLTDLYTAIIDVAPERFKSKLGDYNKATPPGIESVLNILLVEDNLINEKVAVATLSRLGHKVDTAANGKIAVHKFVEKQYDIILMDIQMPEMDGIEATICIRELERNNTLRPRTLIVALTAISRPEDKDHCMRAGMDDYIIKPFRYDELIRVLSLQKPKTKLYE